MVLNTMMLKFGGVVFERLANAVRNIVVLIVALPARGLLMVVFQTPNLQQLAPLIGVEH